MRKYPNFVFMDLTGSSRAYEALGNVRVAKMVSELTRWLGQLAVAYGGETIKFLGDGVLLQFPASICAVSASIFAQRAYGSRIRKWPQETRLGLKIGISSGPAVHMNEDAYGDAVNLASRLADMAGADNIWVDDATIEQLKNQPELPPGIPLDKRVLVLDAGQIHSRCLGQVHIAGLSQPRLLHQIYWNPQMVDLVTMPSELLEESFGQQAKNSIRLRWMDKSDVFTVDEFTQIDLGRSGKNHFVLTQACVSRRHARIEWQNDRFILKDISTYGTWVRLGAAMDSPFHLRRNQCTLHAWGELSLGEPFSSVGAATVAFQVLNSNEPNSGFEDSPLFPDPLP